MSDGKTAEGKKNVNMLGFYILMQRDKPAEKKSPGGIVMPAQQSNLPTWGTVLAVGEGVAADPVVGLLIRIGTRILVGKYTGSDVQINDEAAVVVRLEDVYGVER